MVYADETWLNQGHRTKKEWVDLETLKEKTRRSLRLSGLTVGCTKEMTGKGRRLIISDAMTESGPVKVGSHDPIFSSNHSSAHFLRQQLDV